MVSKNGVKSLNQQLFTSPKVHNIFTFKSVIKTELLQICS